MLHRIIQPSPLVVGIAAAVTSAGLLAAVAPAVAASGSQGPAGHEHMARYVAEARRDQDRVLNPREHLGHRDVVPTASSVPDHDLVEALRDSLHVLNVREHLGHQDVAPGSTPVDPCSSRLAAAWRQLGHFSDGYETYVISNSPSCR